jgi:hypothetical protein
LNNSFIVFPAMIANRGGEDLGLLLLGLRSPRSDLRE